MAEWLDTIFNTGTLRMRNNLYTAYYNTF